MCFIKKQTMSLVIVIKIFFRKIQEEQKNIDIIWFKNNFNYETPDKMLEYLHSLKTTDDYDQVTSLIEESFTNVKYTAEIMSEGDKKMREYKYWILLEEFLSLL